MPAATGRPSPNEPRQPLVLGRRLRRWRNLPSGLLGPMNPRNPWFPASLWRDGPAPTGRNATDHEVGIAREDRTGLTDARTPPDTILLDMTADEERVSSPVQVPRAGPAPGDMWIPTGGLGSSRVSKATDACPSASSSHAHHHRKSSGDHRSLSSSSSRASANRKSPPGHHHERRRESAERSGSSYVSRREVQLSPVVTQSPERRTITVIPLPARPDHMEEPAAEVAGPASVTGPSEVVDGPADDGPASDGPAGDDPASDGPADDSLAYDGSGR